MELCAVLTRDDLARCLDELTPLDVELGRRVRGVISLARPSVLELVAGVGLRVGGEGRLAWDIAGVTVPVHVRHVQALVAPHVVTVDAEPALAFDVTLEALELQSLPRFVETRVRAGVASALAQSRDKLVWRFAKKLRTARALSARITPPSIFAIAPRVAGLAITETEVRMTLSFDASFGRARTSGQAA